MPLSRLWMQLTTSFAELVGWMTPTTAAMLLLVGAVALFYGRRLAWAFTALLGYMLGITIAPLLAGGMLPGWIAQSLMLGIAVIGGLIGIAAHRQAAVVIGALAFAGLGRFVAEVFGWTGIAGGAAIGAGVLLGIALMARRRETTLIAISSFYGAMAILLGLHAVRPRTYYRTEAGIFVVLFMLGLIVQILDYRYSKELVIPPAAGGLPPRRPKP